MARKITINITDQDDPNVCTAQYIVRWKIVGMPDWQSTLSFGTPQIILNGLEDSTEYQVSVTRQCCDGNNSTEQLITINTLPLTDEIEGLAATGGAESISINWDDFTGADGYELYMSQTNDIDTATLAYTGSTSAYNATGLLSSTTYYIWVRAYIGTQYSNYATSSSTTS
jgi:hypothetical protein